MPPLGRGRCGVLLVVERFWLWVPDSVYSAGGGRSSVEAWYTSALDVEKVLFDAVDADGVRPQRYADNLKYVSSGPDQLFRAAQFTAGYVRPVGQEPAPSKCILLSKHAFLGSV